MTIKLTDTQRTALEAAAQDPKGHINLPPRLRGSALTKTLLALKAGKLAVYKRGILTITDTGRVAVGAASAAEAAEQPAKRTSTREDTKQTQLIALLKSAKGVTVAEAAEALHWQQHTVRGAIAGALKKRLGLTVESEKVNNRGRVSYRRVASALIDAGGRGEVVAASLSFVVLVMPAARGSGEHSVKTGPRQQRGDRSASAGSRCRRLARCALGS